MAAFVYPAIEKAQQGGNSFLTVMSEEATIPVAMFCVLMFLAGLALFVQKPVGKDKRQG